MLTKTNPCIRSSNVVIHVICWFSSAGSWCGTIWDGWGKISQNYQGSWGHGEANSSPLPLIIVTPRCQTPLSGLIAAPVKGEVHTHLSSSDELEHLYSHLSAINHTLASQFHAWPGIMCTFCDSLLYVMTNVCTLGSANIIYAGGVFLKGELECCTVLKRCVGRRWWLVAFLIWWTQLQRTRS